MFRTLALLALAAAPAAQSLLALDSMGSTVVEFTGPKRSQWNGPADRLIGLWPTITFAACALPIVFGPPPSLLGDVAVDGLRDTIWATDGATLAEYDRRGTFLRAFPQSIFASPLTGLGVDAELGELWITDGTQAARIQPPGGTCGGVPVVTVGPITLFTTVPPNPATDIEWDPATSTLWVCDSLGNVGNLNPDGSLGPAGGFVATGVCNLTPPLTGVAIDVTRTPVRIFATDGNNIAYFNANGTLAEPTFGTTRQCQLGTGHMVGLSFATRALRFGQGRSPLGPVPEIDALGQVYLGNPSFEVVVRGAAPAGLAFLYQSPEPLCPIGTWELYAMPHGGCPFGLIGQTPVGPMGFASWPQPVPTTLTPGQTTVYQWLILTPTLELQQTQRLMVTLGKI